MPFFIITDNTTLLVAVVYERTPRVILLYSKLETDLNDISKRVELLAEVSNPMEFRKCCDRITAMKQDLEVKETAAEEISERETLLDVPHSDQLPRLEEISTSLVPLDRLWNNAKLFMEKCSSSNNSRATLCAHRDRVRLQGVATSSPISSPHRKSQKAPECAAHLATRPRRRSAWPHAPATTIARTCSTPVSRHPLTARACVALTGSVLAHRS